MFRLPFVSRERYEEALARIAELKAEVAELKAEKNRSIDFIAKNTLGHPIFEREAPPADPTRTTDPAPKSEEEKHSELVKEAIKHGYTKPRAIAEYITKRNEQEYQASRRNFAIATAPRAIVEAPAVEEAPKVNPDFEAAISEGVAAAVSSKGA